ncbi:hypothetical protein KEM48_005468 [Puccinia striiformis f. sp. tritici PST-130]|nr:hypothetical protein KEM48_005468 [Puccinia striiformis f. sp. tritici PST-130]
MHPHDFQSDESFDLFFEDAKEHLVSKYLHDLEQFFSRLPPNHTAIRLACLRRYPQLYDPSRLDTSTMRRALEAESKEDGRAILEAGPRPVFNSRVSGGVIQKGYQSPYLHSPVIVDPILDTLNEYAIEWNNSIYMGPYAALIGPSTSGKSRLLMETAQHICWFTSAFARRTSQASHPDPRSLTLSLTRLSPMNLLYLSSCLLFQVVANFFSIQHPDGNMTDRLKKWNDYTEVASSGSLDIANPTQENSPPMLVLLALDEARALLQSSIPDNDTFFRIFRVLNQHSTPAGDISLSSWGALVSPERLFKYGSPIFGAYFRDAHAERQSTEAIYSAILELAFFKLRGPIELAKSTRPGLTRAQAFAFLGPTIQPRINGATHLNTELIAFHAAHCDYISPNAIWSLLNMLIHSSMLLL